MFQLIIDINIDVFYYQFVTFGQIKIINDKAGAFLAQCLLRKNAASLMGNLRHGIKRFVYIVK